MTGSHGEEVQGPAAFDSLSHTPAPIIELMEPKAAPADMLDQVQVNTTQHRLQTDTPLGTIAVEMWWTMGERFDGRDENRADFFPALDANFDPDAAANPLASQKYPYTILPDGALYQMAIRAPLDAVNAEWSEQSTRPLGGNSKHALLGGTSLAQFRQAFPNVKVDLPDGQYTIEAKERTRPTLAVIARVENGEPLTRAQEVNGSAVRYAEIPSGGFLPSGLHPDTAVRLINSRTTIRPDSDEADVQQLVFKMHDGFQRTGEGAAEHSGLVEVIVLQAEAVQYSEFTFTPYYPPVITSPSPNGYNGYGGFGFGDGPLTRETPLSFGAMSRTFDSGLTGGETRYRPPETVTVSMMGVKDLRAIAAFRFAMTGTRAQDRE